MRRIWTALVAPAMIVLGLLAAGCTSRIAGTGVWDSAGPAGTPVTSAPPATSAPALSPPAPSAPATARPAPSTPAAAPSAPASAPPAPSAPAPITPPPPPTGRAPAVPGPDLAPCYDGTCQVLVRQPVVIPLDPRFGLARLSVTAITAGQVSFEGIPTSGGYTRATVGVGGTAMLNQIVIQVRELSARGAVLRLSPA